MSWHKDGEMVFLTFRMQINAFIWLLVSNIQPGTMVKFNPYSPAMYRLSIAKLCETVVKWMLYSLLCNLWHPSNLQLTEELGYQVHFII